MRKRLFDELQGYNDKLEKLLDSSDEDTQALQRRTTTRQLAAIDSAICSFWVQARNIFRALVLAFKCGCQQHHAKLLLQDRTGKTPDFEVIFTELASTCWEMHRTRISQGDEALAALVKESMTLLDIPSIPPPQPSRVIRRPVRSAFQTRSESSTTICLQQLRFVRPFPQHSLHPPPAYTSFTSPTSFAAPAQ